MLQSNTARNPDALWHTDDPCIITVTYLILCPSVWASNRASRCYPRIALLSAPQPRWVLFPPIRRTIVPLNGFSNITWSRSATSQDQTLHTHRGSPGPPHGPHLHNSLAARVVHAHGHAACHAQATPAPQSNS